MSINMIVCSSIGIWYLIGVILIFFNIIDKTTIFGYVQILILSFLFGLIGIPYTIDNIIKNKWSNN